MPKKTQKIWVVRHAEKNTENPKEKDPKLSDEGVLRAKDLKEFLKKKRVAYIFSSNYIRTKQTVAPLAEERKLPIETYDTSKPLELINTVKGLPKGKNILIVGHSNTVLNIVRDLGAQISLKELKDDDYDFIFELTKKRKNTTLKVMHFGKTHHSTNF